MACDRVRASVPVMLSGSPASSGRAQPTCPYRAERTRSRRKVWPAARQPSPQQGKQRDRPESPRALGLHCLQGRIPPLPSRAGEAADEKSLFCPLVLRSRASVELGKGQSVSVFHELVRTQPGQGARGVCTANLLETRSHLLRGSWVLSRRRGRGGSHRRGSSLRCASNDGKCPALKAPIDPGL